MTATPSTQAEQAAPKTLEPSKVLPLRMTSIVVRGYGRGSADLGIPTANLDRDSGKYSLDSFDDLPTGTPNFVVGWC
jgi:Riboflavin kinase